MLSVLQRDNVTYVSLDRDVDLLHASEVQEVLLSLVERPSPRVILDLRVLRTVDSAGLATFLLAARRARRNHGRLLFVVGDSHALRLFQLTGVDRVFELHETAEAAYDALTRS